MLKQRNGAGTILISHVQKHGTEAWLSWLFSWAVGTWICNYTCGRLLIYFLHSNISCFLKHVKVRIIWQALEILCKLGREINVQPNIVFCGIFLSGCSQAGSVSHAEKCLRFINEKGMKEDELIYLELMKVSLFFLYSH